MKDLQTKLKELNQKLGALNNSLENLEREFNQSELQVINANYKFEKQMLLEKIDTLEKAQEILLGIR